MRISNRLGLLSLSIFLLACEPTARFETKGPKGPSVVHVSRGDTVPETELSSPSSNVDDEYLTADFVLPFERYGNLIRRRSLNRNLVDRPGGEVVETSLDLNKNGECVLVRKTESFSGEVTQVSKTMNLMDCAHHLLAKELNQVFTGCPKIRAPLVAPNYLLTKDKITSVRYGWAQVNADCSCTQTHFDGNPHGEVGYDAGWTETLACDNYQLTKLLRAAEPDILTLPSIVEILEDSISHL
jgi:hypothetical protein